MGRKWRILVFFCIVMLLGSIVGITSKDVTGGIRLGLDLNGGFEVLYKVEPTKKGDEINKDVMMATVKALEKRVNVLGISETKIDIEGGNRIRVQLAGVKDQAKAREILSTEANLTFRDVNDKLLMDGSDLKEGGAKQSFDQQNRPNVTLTLKSAKKFQDVTKHVLGMAPNNLLVIWLDYEEGVDTYKNEAAKVLKGEKPKYVSAASVSEVFTQPNVSIQGNFTVEEAKEMADILNAGSLPVHLKEIYSQSISAAFGSSALNETIKAGIVGVALVFLFMLLYYRLPGVIAVISLCAYIFTVLVIFKWMNGVLTLPGIAALVLGIGMAVDANIITYERIKDELRLGKSVVSAFRAGNKRSFATILDANLTHMIASAVLFYFGTSAVKGFATMALLSTVVVFITNVFFARILLSLLVNSRFLNNKLSWFGVKKNQILDIHHKEDEAVPTPFDKIDFVHISKYFLWFAGAMLVTGIIVLSFFKLNLSIDFASGTRYEITADKAISQQVIKDEFAKFGKEPKDIVLSKEDKLATVRFKGAFTQKEILETKNYFKNQYGSEPNVSTVSPQIGKEMARNAIISVLIASLGIIIYVAFRFEFFFGISAVIALLHDAFFIITVFSILRIEVDLTFIAAVLTIVGYSVNDTIVTFDRIRENMGKMKKIRGYDDLAYIVNISIRQTLIRSMNTVLTVLITSLALLFLGSSAIANFSLALTVGLLCGTYSSIFIASKLWLIMKSKNMEKQAKKLQEANAS